MKTSHALNKGLHELGKVVHAVQKGLLGWSMATREVT